MKKFLCCFHGALFVVSCYFTLICPYMLLAVLFAAMAGANLGFMAYIASQPE